MQSSHGAWEHAKPKGQWKEVSTEFDGWCSREGRVRRVESAATDEKQEERDRGRLRDRLVEFRQSPKMRRRSRTGTQASASQKSEQMERDKVSRNYTRQRLGKYRNLGKPLELVECEGTKKDA